MGPVYFVARSRSTPYSLVVTVAFTAAAGAFKVSEDDVGINALSVDRLLGVEGVCIGVFVTEDDIIPLG